MDNIVNLIEKLGLKTISTSKTKEGFKTLFSDDSYIIWKDIDDYENQLNKKFKNKDIKNKRKKLK